MPAKNPETVARQIAVILGTSGSVQSLLNILQQLLGKDSETDLHGVFIEDDELKYVAALPFVKELCRLTSSIREIEETGFDRTVALRRRSARNAIEGLARRVGIYHTFREARGSTIKLVHETVHSADITVFEPLRKLAPPAIRQTVQSRATPRRIVVVIDDVETGEEALLAATRIAEDETNRISILLRADSPTELEALKQLTGSLLPGKPIHLLLLPDHGVQQLVTAVLAERADMLVLGASEELIKPESLGFLLKQLECPICLVR
jgi:hypothetical protein